MKTLLGVTFLLLATLAVPAQRPMDEDAELRPPPPEELEGQPPPPPPIQRLMAHWKEKNPEEFERMQKLREEDPQAFRQALQRKLENARRDHGMGPPSGDEFGHRGGPGGGNPEGNPRMRETEEQIMKLARDWRAATTEEDKARLRDELASALSKAFDQRESLRAERLAQMEKKLTELRSVMEQRREQRSAIIEKRLQELTTGDQLAW